jgi:hypothetical protein
VWLFVQGTVIRQAYRDAPPRVYVRLAESLSRSASRLAERRKARPTITSTPSGMTIAAIAIAATAG